MIYVSENLDNDNDTLIELILHINILQQPTTLYNTLRGTLARLRMH